MNVGGGVWYGLAAAVGGALGWGASKLLEEQAEQWGIDPAKFAIATTLGGTVVGAALAGTVPAPAFASGTPTPAPAPALPPATSSQNYTADTSNSGGSLTMKVGDTVTITLPGTPGSWQWSATPNVAWVSETQGAAALGGVTSIDIFRAATAGTGQIQGQMNGALFVINVTVIGG